MRKLTDKDIEYLVKVQEFPLLYAVDIQHLIDENLIEMSSGKVQIQGNLLDCKYTAVTDKGQLVLEQQDPVKIIRVCSRIGRYKLVKKFMVKVPKAKLVEFLTSEDPIIRDAVKGRHQL